MFEQFIARWDLIPAGDPIETAYSALLPVTWRGRAAVLKIAHAEEERRGGGLMQWWNGDGAAEVYARDGDGLLLERAMGQRSLVEMAAAHDNEATKILCDAAARLHAHRGTPPDLIPLDRWFRALAPAAAANGGVFAESAKAAADLLGAPWETVVLHGDIHHGNVLDFGKRGWLAIDPKGLRGERGFDYANLFCNPDDAIAANRFDARMEIVSAMAGIERQRLLKWLLAWCGLSAAWMIEDGLSPEGTLGIGRMAAARLG
jgi:streptomycin 6-kinase